MFHVYGEFVEGDHYSLIKEKVELLESLWKQSENEANEEVAQQLDLLTEEIDYLELRAGNDKDGYDSIRDFKIINGVCEFKVK